MVGGVYFQKNWGEVWRINHISHGRSWLHCSGYRGLAQPAGSVPFESGFSEPHKSAERVSDSGSFLPGGRLPARASAANRHRGVLITSFRAAAFGGPDWLRSMENGYDIEAKATRTI